MKTRLTKLLLCVMLASMLLAGCGTKEEKIQKPQEVSESQETTDTEQVTDAEEVTAAEQTEETTDAEQITDAQQAEEVADANPVTVRIGSLKGPTSIGLMKLMELAKASETVDTYEFEMAAAADEILPKMVSGDLDIALVPANVASVLYNKTQGGIAVIDINTLGVLYAVSGDTAIQSMSDLQGKTVYLTGKGTTPDYVLRYLLRQNGIADEQVRLEYKSEATEVAAVLTKDPGAIGVLPQPFVTATCMKNEELCTVLDLTKEWDAVQGDNGSKLVTGVTVVRRAFMDEHEDAVKRFMDAHRESAAFANENVEATAELVAAAGIIDKAPLAAKAIPNCNITYVDGTAMKDALSGYLQVLFEEDAKAVGGELPADDFYYAE